MYKRQTTPVFRITRAFCLFLFCAGLLFLGGERRVHADGGLAGKLRETLKSPSLKGAACGVVVRDLTGGSIVLDVRGTQPLIPASNQKLITTACALETLGRDFTFRTRLYATGPVGAGVLRGDLVVKGSGDPNISARFHNGDPCAVFKQWAEVLKNLGVKKITGDIIGDDRLFDRQYVHPSWPRNQLHKWYCAPVGALVLNDGCLDVTVKPGAKPGAPAVCRLSPPTRYVTVANSCTTTAKRKERLIDITRAPGTRRVLVRGKVVRGEEGQTFNVTVDDPGMFFITVLRETLEREGIKVEGKARLAAAGEKPACGILVAEHASTLAATLAVCNKRSQNLYAECLLKLIGAKAGGKGSFKAGARALSGFMKKAGIPEGEYSFADGSGMSRRNTVSPRAITAVLARMFKSANCHTYWASLAVSGMDGTLKKRFRKPDAKGRIAAKSGFLNGVSALSGYVVTPGGRYYAFSIIANNIKGSTAGVKKVQEKLCRVLLEHGDK